MLLIITSLFIIFIIYFIYRITQRTRINLKTVNTMIVIGSGGHLSEMLTIISKLDFKIKYSPITFVIAEDDTLSIKKISSKYGNLSNCDIITIKRSRHVGQSYLSSIVTTLHSLIQSLIICYKINPDLLICNGPGTCIPICFAVRFICFGSIIIFIESFCRTKTLSLSGKILYYCKLSDYFLVQWPELMNKYKKTKYIGLLV